MTASRPLLRSLAAALVVAAGLAGCDHVTEPDGPRLIDQFGPFAVLEGLDANRDSVRFPDNQSIVFTARFSKQVDWVIEITGQESGAVKRIEGFSAEVSPENARWAGGTTDLPLFKSEPVEAALFVPAESSDTLRTAIRVVEPREYAGAVFEDFEDDPDVFIGNFEFEFDLSATGVSSEVPAGQGDAFLLLRSRGGLPVVADRFFLGLIDVRPPGGGVLEVPTTVPEDLYMNFFLRGFATDFTIPVVQLIVDGNGTGAYEIDQDIAIPFGDLTADFDGWQLVSAPLSELGVTEEQAGQIVGVRVLLITDADAQPSPPLPVDFGIDYITFTAGGPFQP